MGSFLTRTYLIAYPGTLDGAILSGTGQEPAPLVALGRALSALECRRLGPQGVSPLVDTLSLGAYNRRFRPNRTSADWISRDPAAVDAYLADPLCRSKPTVSMFRDMMEGLQFIAVRDNLRKMDPSTPVLLLSGDRDPVGGMGRGVRKVQNMFLDAGCTDVTLKLYPAAGTRCSTRSTSRKSFRTCLPGWRTDCPLDAPPVFGYNVPEEKGGGFCDLSGSSGRRPHLQRPQLQGLSGVQRARLRQHHARSRGQGHRHCGHPQL